MTDAIEVQIDVLSNRPTGSLSSATARELTKRYLEPTFREAAASRRILESLSLPAEIPVNLSVVVRSSPEEGRQAVPVMVTVGSTPELLSKLKGRIQEEIENSVFDHLSELSIPQELAEFLGIDSSSPSRFKLHLSKEHPRVMSSAELAVAASCGPGTEYSWSKGCNSWPS